MLRQPRSRKISFTLLFTTIICLGGLVYLFFSLYRPELPDPILKPEIANPGRGAQYYVVGSSNGEHDIPPGWPLSDTAGRFCLSRLEPEEGVYNFSTIDIPLIRARNRGYKFGWRIMLMPKASCLPDFLKKRLELQENNGNFVINYDDPRFLSYIAGLIKVLGERYDNNPYVDNLDMSFYGCWSEWHGYCNGNSDTPYDIQASQASKNALIDLQYQAFPHKRFFMLTPDRESMQYALSIPRIQPTGIRADCLGAKNMMGDEPAFTENTNVNELWKLAPVYFEYCGKPSFDLAQQQIEMYHPSYIGNGDGNITAFNKYDPHQQAMIQENYISSGYRFSVQKVDFPQSVQAGSTFSLSSSWLNQNVAPAYNQWDVLFQLRSTDPAGCIVWQGRSDLDLRIPFTGLKDGEQPVLPREDAPTTTPDCQGNNGIPTQPTEITNPAQASWLNGLAGTANAQRQIKDTFTLSANTQPGIYQLCLQITDPFHVYQPMTLDNQGVTDHAPYCPGTIQVA